MTPSEPGGFYTVAIWFTDGSWITFSDVSVMHWAAHQASGEVHLGSIAPR